MANQCEHNERGTNQQGKYSCIDYQRHSRSNDLAPPNTSSITERIACILCMHLGACRIFTHPTALMHLKKQKLNLKKMHPAAFSFSCTNTNGISQRIIIKDYIITQTLINETALIGFRIANPKLQFKAVSFSDIF